jgi:hypothetical protein
MIFRKLNFLISLITLSVLLINFSHADKLPVGYPECWQDTKNPIILNLESPNQFCPLNSKLGHKFFLVDFTSPLKQPQIDWISGRIFGNALVKETAPYHKISYMKIDNTAPQSQEISYSKCRFKTGNKSKFAGEETNTGCEGQKQIGEVYTAWTALTNEFENKFLVNKKEGKRSLIFEYLFHVLREAKTDFTSEYPERELVIVSDLMQHSDRFSFYRHCKTDLSLKKPNKCKSFEKLLKNKKVKNYIDDRKPKKDTLSNLKVTILYINHDYETRDGLSSTLVALWEDLFKYIGITNYEIVKQLDIK